MQKYSLKVAPILHLTIGDIDIEQVTDAKLLGITADSKMSWNSQIDQIVVKMGMAAIKHCR